MPQFPTVTSRVSFRHAANSAAVQARFFFVHAPCPVALGLLTTSGPGLSGSSQSKPQNAKAGENARFLQNVTGFVPQAPCEICQRVP